MRKATFIAITLWLVPLVSQIVYAQTTADLESLVTKSKLVDTTHPVRAMISSDKQQVSISTFCRAQTTDKDCKITALLMMKELMQRYKTVHGIRVTFFDEVNPHHSRTVRTTEGDALLVDSGKPVHEVLALIDISYGDVRPRTTVESSKKQSNLAANPATPASGVNGTWTSGTALVIIQQSAGSQISGFWSQEGVSHKLRGSYNSRTRILDLSFEQLQSDDRPPTTGRFELTRDGKELVGSWKVGGETGNVKLYKVG